MRSRRYDIKLRAVTYVIQITVYADRSVQLGMRRHDSEFIPRPMRLNTRDEAAWSLTFARSGGQEITRTFL